MSPPPGCEEPNGHVWRLHSGQYGLRQSSNAFARMLLLRLYEFGFKAASADECVLVYREPMEGANDGSESVLVILTVVDDLLEVGNDQRLLRRVLDHLKQYFQLTEDGEIDFFLGVKFTRDSDCGTST
eukprot:1975827-Rhodomonas_salina.1